MMMIELKFNRLASFVNLHTCAKITFLNLAILKLQQNK